MVLVDSWNLQYYQEEIGVFLIFVNLNEKSLRIPGFKWIRTHWKVETTLLHYSRKNSDIVLPFFLLKETIFVNNR